MQEFKSLWGSMRFLYTYIKFLFLARLTQTKVVALIYASAYSKLCYIRLDKTSIPIRNGLQVILIYNKVSLMKSQMLMIRRIWLLKWASLAALQLVAPTRRVRGGRWVRGSARCSLSLRCLQLLSLMATQNL